MIRSLLSLVLVTLLAGCAGKEQNQLLGAMLGRAMQETSLSGTDQGLAVQVVQVAAQSAGEQSTAPRDDAQGSSEPAVEEAEAW